MPLRQNPQAEGATKQAAWSVAPVTCKSARDKLALSHNGQRVCDISIFTPSDDARARFIVQACNAHDSLVAALTAARDYMDAFGCDADMAPTMDKIEAALRSLLPTQDVKP